MNNGYTQSPGQALLRPPNPLHQALFFSLCVVLRIDFTKQLVHQYQATINYSLKVKNNIVMFPTGILVAG